MKNKFRWQIIIAIIFALVVGSFGLSGSVDASTVSEQMQGRILLQVEKNGEAWYINPQDGLRYYMRNGKDAWELMKSFGVGISNADLRRIPESTVEGGDISFAERFSGQILLQVEDAGKAWYISPVNLHRYYLGSPAGGYALMRDLGLGITDANLEQIKSAGDPANIIHAYFRALNKEDFQQAYRYESHNPYENQGVNTRDTGYDLANYEEIIVNTKILGLDKEIDFNNSFVTYAVEGVYDFGSRVSEDLIDGQMILYVTLTKEDDFWKIWEISAVAG